MTWVPDQPRVGYWTVKCCRNCPFVAARIWLCEHEPGETDNAVDQPYLQGQIGLDLTPPLEIWSLLEYCESSPDQRRLIENPPLSDRAPRNNRSPAFTAPPMPKWQQNRARRITLVEYQAEQEWLSWAQTNAPTHHDFTFRRPLDPRTAQIPRFV